MEIIITSLISPVIVLFLQYLLNKIINHLQVLKALKIIFIDQYTHELEKDPPGIIIDKNNYLYRNIDKIKLLKSNGYIDNFIDPHRNLNDAYVFPKILISEKGRKYLKQIKK